VRGIEYEDDDEDDRNKRMEKPWRGGGSVMEALRAFAVAVLLAVPAFGAGSNLVYNGSFDSPDDPLVGWQREFKGKGESSYADNEKFVEAIPQDGNRSKVLRLKVADQRKADFEGVKVESQPIPFETGSYRFSVYARSTGPNCRIMLEGYTLRPGLSPGVNPSIYDLRKCYRFTQLFFGRPGGDMGGVGPSWKEAETVIPEKKLSELAREKFEEIEYVVVHVVAIGGKAGDLLVDSVKLERIGP
jgi:hypothetical protein